MRLTKQEAALLVQAGAVLDSGNQEAQRRMSEALEAGRMTAAELLLILQQTRRAAV